MDLAFKTGSAYVCMMTMSTFGGGQSNALEELYDCYI